MNAGILKLKNAIIAALNAIGRDYGILKKKSDSTSTELSLTKQTVASLEARLTLLEKSFEDDARIKKVDVPGAPILLSKNLNKVLCTVNPKWTIMFIDWREGTNTGWSTYTSTVVNKGGFFQFRFQNCPFALQINSAGELKCYSMDSGQEAFIRSILYR